MNDIWRRTSYVLLGFASLVLLLHSNPLCAQSHLPNFLSEVQHDLNIPDDRSSLNYYLHTTKSAIHNYSFLTFHRLNYFRQMTECTRVSRRPLATAPSREHQDNTFYLNNSSAISKFAILISPSLSYSLLQIQQKLSQTWRHN